MKHEVSGVLLVIFFLLIAFAGGCIKTKKPEPFNATNVRIVQVITDKPGYAPGDTVEGTVIVESISNYTINHLTLWVTAKNLNYAWAGDKAQTRFKVEYNDLNLGTGNKTALNASINIPREVSGFSTAGEYELKVEVYAGAQLCDFKVIKMTVK